MGSTSIGAPPCLAEHLSLCGAQPPNPEGQGSEQVDGPSRYPHDEPPELLVLERREPPRRGVRVCRIPGRGGQRQQGPKQAAVQRGGKHSQHCDPVALQLLMAIEQGPPEVDRRSKKTQVL